MTRESRSSSIVRNLQITFSVSILLLVLSLISSFFSVQKLIDNSILVNRTNEVLIESENVLSFLKDGETGQRGYLVTKDTSFLEPYKGSKSKALSSYLRVKQLTQGNDIQQERCHLMRKLIYDRYHQMENVLETAYSGSNASDPAAKRKQHSQMLIGKKIMDELRRIINEIKQDERQVLADRISSQEAYIDYARALLVIAALVSIVISVFSYIRIRADIDQRTTVQQEDEQKYAETSRRISQLEAITNRIARGEYDVRSTDLAPDEMGRIGKALNNMAEHLQANFEEIGKQIWLKEGAVQLSDAMRGERNVSALSEKLLGSLSQYLSAPVGTIYVSTKNSVYQLMASHAVKNPEPQLTPGEGITGQVIRNRKLQVITDLPSNYLGIQSSTGSASLVSLIILPLIFEDESIGVIELGMLRMPEPREIELLNANTENISIAINASLDHQMLQNLLEETQAQAEELQAQHSELENLNSELEAQAHSLQASEEELKVQQEELLQTNAELEERSSMLEEKNQEIQSKAEELAQTTRYKSEFLANMSHELRTPLNSILLLSRLLSDNSDNNLSSEQIEYARVIQSSGNGLLWLIDEILDLSKIEAGKMELEYRRFEVQSMVGELRALFQPLTNEKGITLETELSDDLPAAIETDRMRLEQILRNLVSNAIKFTSEGGVKLSTKRCPDNNRFICFTVKDTGIGIPKEKQHLVFQAFQQADGSTRRKYGGTGLGLSISRELAKLLGGVIRLTSEPGQGSEFTVYIPIERFKEGIDQLPEDTNSTPPVAEEASAEAPDPRYISPVIPPNVKDDRSSIQPGDNCILIVEDDVIFAKSLLEYTRTKGYKGIVTVRGDEVLELAVHYRPTGILLDIQLPVKSGWEVMDELKKNQETRHIPVHMMSSHQMKKQSMLKGAVDFMEKPVSPEQMQEIFGKIEVVLTKNPKKVLIVEDNARHAEALSFFLESNNINTEVKTDVHESIAALQAKDLDCVILDMGIPANNAYEVLEEIKRNDGLEDLPIIIFTGKSLSMSEEQRIKQYADSIIIKTAQSYRRMLDEVSLFLHLVEESKVTANVAEHKKLGALSEVLNNKTVLIADDDIRNVFSLTKALESLKLNVITSMDGKQALQRLEEHPETDIVLLDMMMPEMDGYETARRIREIAAHKKLPIIAVTAKAMTGDREKCISAGASDYITKPVDIDQLLSLLRVWLYKGSG